EPLRSLARVPERTPLFRSFSKPLRSPAEGLFSKLPPKPLPDHPSESATCPGSHLPESPFDTPSKQTLRSFLRNAPRDPKVKPKVSPEAFFEVSSEHATCSRVPSGKPFLPDSSRAATCPRMPFGKILPEAA